ncbi:MAG: CaiB/BaiF CoA transferase family protein [Desulfohalobiaceae bacterium]
MLEQGVLQGVTVLDLSRLLPGPYCSMLLADHGARVIAVEGQSPGDFFVSQVYRNKEHICLDLKSEPGLAVFLQLAAQADVILEGFRPGVAGRLGVDYRSVRRVNPEVVYCSLTGYGQSGPGSEKAGHDVNYLAVSGVLDLLGLREASPSIPGVQFADLAGGLNAALGIILALLHRGRTGKGQYIDISIADCSLALLPLVQHLEQSSGQKLSRGDNLLSHRYACYNVYETLDQRYLALGALEGKFWQRLCRHLGLQELIPLQFDESRRQEVVQTLRRIFKQKALAVWQQELGELDICITPVQSLQEAQQDPLFLQRDMIPEKKGPGQESKQGLGVQIKLQRTPGSVRNPAPGFGQDTCKVLQELGYSKQEIEGLLQQGVCGGTSRE